jgi:hypothetical protein
MRGNPLAMMGKGGRGSVAAQQPTAPDHQMTDELQHKVQTRTRLRARAATLVLAVVGLLLAVSAPASAQEDNPTLTVDYDAAGSTHIGARVDASMPVGPTVLSSTLDLVTGDIVAGSMDIPDQVLRFDIFGIATRAKVSMTQNGPLTGALEQTDQLGKARLTSNVSYDIRISEVEARVFGIWWPLAVGSNCRTIDPVDISARTPQGEFFTINDGGRVTATYTIGKLTGCAPLNFFDIPGFFPWFGSIPLNMIVPGHDNTLDLQLSNPRFGG